MRTTRAGTALALAAALAISLSAPAQEEPPTPDKARELIAALDLEGAKEQLARLKAAAKTPDEKAAAKMLEQELAAAKKIEPVAEKQVPKLLADGKKREAYALAMATVDQFPGALAIPGLAARVREARDEVYLVVEDFDKSALPPGKAHEGGKGNTPKTISGIEALEGTIELVDDPMGGRALKWSWNLAAGAYSAIGWRLPETIDAASFDHLTLRVRAPKPLGKPLNVNLMSLPLEKDNRGKLQTTVAVGAGWRELRVPLDKPEKKGAYDSKKVARLNITTFSPGAMELYVDEVMLSRRGK